MRQTLIERKDHRQDGMPEMLCQWLPPHILLALAQVKGNWQEVHLRVGRACSVTVEGENRIVPLTLCQEEMEELLTRFCGGSMYAHREGLSAGYIALPGGVRVGVCGEAALQEEDGGILGVRAPNTLCIRFARTIDAVGGALVPRVQEVFPQGTLIYSPPGVGKTTLLRALARRFAGGERPLRVAVVDSRCELVDTSMQGELCLSVLSGYPKARGIEIAVRSLNAQLIVCDEIGNEKEGEALLGAANCGVPVMASAHAATIHGLLCRPAFAHLHRAGVFGLYVGISRRPGTREYDYCYHDAREVKA